MRTIFNVATLSRLESCVPQREDPEGGGQGVRTPLENHKNIGSFSNTGSAPL